MIYSGAYGREAYAGIVDTTVVVVITPIPDMSAGITILVTQEENIAVELTSLEVSTLLSKENEQTVLLSK
jgi:hypothetical protein